jgi:hypothetical protein
MDARKEEMQFFLATKHIRLGMLCSFRAPFSRSHEVYTSEL